MSGQEWSFPARDGRSLAATLWEGDGPDLALIAGATGVPRRFYRDFGDWLQSQGCRALSFDYRGVAGSAPATLRGEGATLADWGRLDLAGALDAARGLGAQRIFVVGHSVGGQLLGLTEDTGVAAAALVASQSGYWRLWPAARRPAIWLLWNALIPASTATLGYFPASRLGMGEDLPTGVARQWAAWGRHPDYLWSMPGAQDSFAAFRAPVLAIALTDDQHFAPTATVDALAARYGGPVTRRDLSPAEVGLKSIGHFGFFRARAAAAWPELLAWLRDAPPRPGAAP